MENSTHSPIVRLYMTGLADVGEKLHESFSQIIRLSHVNQNHIDPGVDECLALDVAAESVVSCTEALVRLAQELKTRQILQEEKQVNKEIAERRAMYKKTQQEVDAVVLRVRMECKASIEELMLEYARK